MADAAADPAPSLTETDLCRLGVCRAGFAGAQRGEEQGHGQFAVAQAQGDLAGLLIRRETIGPEPKGAIGVVTSAFDVGESPSDAAQAGQRVHRDRVGAGQQLRGGGRLQVVAGLFGSLVDHRPQPCQVQLSSADGSVRSGRGVGPSGGNGSRSSPISIGGPKAIGLSWSWSSSHPPWRVQSTSTRVRRAPSRCPR